MEEHVLDDNKMGLSRARSALDDMNSSSLPCSLILISNAQVFSQTHLSLGFLYPLLWDFQIGVLKSNFTKQLLAIVIKLKIYQTNTSHGY